MKEYSVIIRKNNCLETGLVKAENPQEVLLELMILLQTKARELASRQEECISIDSELA